MIGAGYDTYFDYYSKGNCVIFYHDCVAAILYDERFHEAISKVLIENDLHIGSTVIVTLLLIVFRALPYIRSRYENK